MRINKQEKKQEKKKEEEEERKMRGGGAAGSTHQSCTALKLSSLLISYMRMKPMAPR